MVNYHKRIFHAEGRASILPSLQNRPIDIRVVKTNCRQVLIFGNRRGAALPCLSEVLSLTSSCNNVNNLNFQDTRYWVSGEARGHACHALHD